MKTLSLLFVLMLGSALGEVGTQDNTQDGGIKVYEKIVGGEFVLFISNADGSNERVFTKGGEPSISPDQTRVAFSRRGSLYLIHIDGTQEQKLLDALEHRATPGIGASGAVSQPFWSPDGQTIFFDWLAAMWSALHAINADGTNPRKIIGPGSLSADSWPSPFSPDNRKILINNCFDDCYTLLVFDLDQNTLIKLSDRSERGSWSPDGQRIAFGDVYDRRLNIINVDGAGQIKLLEKIEALSELSFRVRTITWSPDGQRLAFTAAGLSNGEVERIYEARLDGAELQQREVHYSAPSPLTPTDVEPATWGQVKEETR